jgi:hypothetical protein
VAEVVESFKHPNRVSFVLEDGSPGRITASQWLQQEGDETEDAYSEHM